MKKFLFTIGLLAVSFATLWGQFKYVKVDAPFSMKPIKEFIYPDQDFSIVNYGAVKGGEADVSDAIAGAITACNQAGGGRVVIPEGEWLTGPIHLKSNVNLYFWKKWFARPKAHMDALRKLYTMASKDVPVEKRQMTVGENHLRPHLIHFNRCENVLLDSFKIRESPFWTIHMYMCNGGIVRNLDVKAHGHNNDGIDLEMTRNFLVEDCTFDQGDDAVVIKAGRNRDAWRLNTPTENIVIRNCNILEGHTLLGIGSEISGGIRNVYMHDCKAPQSVRRLFFVKTNHRRGAFIENIHMENIRTGHVQRVLEIDTDVLYQWRELVPTYEERITRIEGIYLKNVICDSADAIYELKGDAKLPVKNVVIQDVHVDKVNDFVKKVHNVKNVKEDNVTYGSLH